VKTGLQASALGNIRAEIWWKALGNLAVNPISAISKRDDDRDLALSRNARPRA
jgi:ketopantoate reductase